MKPAYSATLLAVLMLWFVYLASGGAFFGFEHGWREKVNNITYLTAMGGFCGGLAMFVYIQPKSIPDAFVRIVVAIMVSNMLTQLLGSYITHNQSPSELWGVSFLLGFSAWSVFGAMARFFAKREGHDIVEMARDVKGVSGDVKMPEQKSKVDSPD
jgi:hypothetical protein